MAFSFLVVRLLPSSAVQSSSLPEFLLQVESPLHTQRVNSENFGLTLELPDGVIMMSHYGPLSGCVVPFIVKPSCSNSLLKLFTPRFQSFPNKTATGSDAAHHMEKVATTLQSSQTYDLLTQRVRPRSRDCHASLWF